MDPIVLTIVIKGTVAFILGVGALTQSVFGFRVYRDGSSSPEKNSLNYGKFKLNTSSGGAFIMGTAVLWGALAVTASPSLTKHKEDWKVASFSAQGNEVTARTFATALPGGELVTDPQTLKVLFDKAARSAGTTGKATDTKFPVTINGKPAKVDLNSLSVGQSPFGGYVITSRAQSGTQAALLTFRPQHQEGQLVFYPVGVVDATEFPFKPRPRGSPLQIDPSKFEGTGPNSESKTPAMGPEPKTKDETGPLLQKGVQGADGVKGTVSPTPTSPLSSGELPTR